MNRAIDHSAFFARRRGIYKNLSEAIAGILLTMWGLVGNSMRTLYTLNNGKPDISRFMQIQVSGGRKNNAHGSSRDVYIAIVSLPLLRHKHCQYIGRIRILCDTSRKSLLNLEGKNWNLLSSRLERSGKASMLRQRSHHFTKGWRRGCRRVSFKYSRTSRSMVLVVSAYSVLQ